jgi:hypothetical protein
MVSTRSRLCDLLHRLCCHMVNQHQSSSVSWEQGATCAWLLAEHTRRDYQRRLRCDSVLHSLELDADKPNWYGSTYCCFLCLLAAWPLLCRLLWCSRKVR